MSIELGLGKIKKLLFKLGNPERELKVIHVAGTNGKGSTISYIYSILIEAGYRVGRYVSPAVFDDYEIIQINNKNIDPADYNIIMNKVNAVADTMGKQPSEFEKQTALAMIYFKEQKCDICIVETGLGGALDATNVFKKVLCSVITSVGYDHMEYLGDSIEDIARNKAGIIKNYCHAVLAPQKYEKVEEVVYDVADRIYAKVLSVNSDMIKDKGEEGFSYESLVGEVYSGIKPKSQALYQRENICTAIEVITVLNYYQQRITREAVVNGINNAEWSGRFEKISDEPQVYIDGAHNPDGAQVLRETIEKHFAGKKLTLIMGMFADKDYEEVVDIMAPLADKIITVTPDNVRALDCKILAESVRKITANVSGAETVQKAVDEACKDKDNVILAFGSLSFLKDVKGCFE